MAKDYEKWMEKRVELEGHNLNLSLWHDRIAAIEAIYFLANADGNFTQELKDYHMTALQKVLKTEKPAASVRPVKSKSMKNWGKAELVLRWNDGEVSILQGDRAAISLSAEWFLSHIGAC